MKAIYLILSMIAAITFTSCSAEDTETTEKTTSTFSLESTYGARNVAYNESEDNELKLNELPAISLEEADNLLSSLRKHNNAKEEWEVEANEQGKKTKLNVCMKQTINGKHAFYIQLNITSYADGSLYYNGYTANCESEYLKWYLKGFSFTCDNTTGLYKFESQSFLYLKVVNNGIKYMQVPVRVKGNYNPENHQASFEYTL